MTNTIDLLIRWGLWQKSGNSLGYVSPNFELMLKVGVRESRPDPLDDDTAMIVDRAVARLLRRDKEMGAIVIYRYAYGHSLRDIGRKTRQSKDKIYTLHNSAIAWIDGVIEGLKQDQE